MEFTHRKRTELVQAGCNRALLVIKSFEPLPALLSQLLGVHVFRQALRFRLAHRPPRTQLCDHTNIHVYTEKRTFGSSGEPLEGLNRALSRVRVRRMRIHARCCASAVMHCAVHAQFKPWSHVSARYVGQVACSTTVAIASQTVQVVCSKY